MFETITSFQNPRVKLIKKLRDKKARDRENRFVIDYERDFERALACGFEVDFVFFCPDLGHDQFNFDVPFSRVFQIPREIMEKVSYRQSPSSIVAVMYQQQLGQVFEKDVVWNKPLLALVDLQKPGNIGALLRTADAAGITSILMVDSSLDIYNPNIIRASTGAVFSLNVYALTSADAIRFLKQESYTIFSTHLSGTLSLYEADFPMKSAIVLGTEDKGLDEQWVEACDMLIKIPMVGSVTDSLNVSVTGAICMYEMFRQHNL